jgi:uncharacterized protein
VLFDAIEFSPLIASGDVLYDLAFPLMDLTQRALQPLANIMLNRYLTESGRAEDLDALAALPFFLSLRAAIRAKVTSARLAQARAESRPDIEAAARSYLDWARRFIAPVPPVLVAIGGLSGTGKSVLARALAATFGPAPGALVLRSDVERKRLFGKDEHARLSGEAYAPQVTARVYATIVDQARRAIAAGHSAIVDAVFARPGERSVVERSAAILGVTFHGLFLDAEIDVRLARLGNRSPDASDADAPVARQQESYDLGELSWQRVDASGTPEETLQRALAAIQPMQM